MFVDVLCPRMESTAQRLCAAPFSQDWCMKCRRCVPGGSSKCRVGDGGWGGDSGGGRRDDRPISGRAGITEGVAGETGAAARGVGPITGYTRHGLNQAISREGVGVSPRAILDAVRNPQRILQRPGGITEYVGEAARVRLNEAGEVVTVIPRGSQGFRVGGTP